jgi:membrane protease YdiL (CAAX protease family)
MGFLITEWVFGAVGVFLILVLRVQKRVHIRNDVATLKVGLLYLIPLLSFAIFFTSSFGQSLVPLRQIKDFFLQGPMSHMILNSSVLFVIIFGFSAGICEEILFRGAIQTKTGIITASILFAAVHAVNLPLGALTLIFGFYFGLIYKRTGNNLLASSFVHSLYTIAVIFLLRSSGH